MNCQISRNHYRLFFIHNSCYNILHLQRFYGAEMTILLDNLEKTTDYAVNILKIIKDIVKSYLADDSSDDIYDKSELLNFLKKLTPQTTLNLKHEYQNAVKLYGQPLPIRPHFVTLFHAQFELIMQLKEHCVDLDGKNLREATEMLFFTAMSDVFAKNPFNIKKINLKLIDAYFEELESAFRISFMALARRPIIEAEKAQYPTPKQLEPQSFIDPTNIECELLSGVHVAELSSFDFESRITSTPFSLFPTRSSTNTTNKMFQTPTSAISMNTVYDSDGEEIEEIICDLA